MKNAKLLAGLVSLLVCLPFASAQVVSSSSDLILGFRATGKDANGNTLNSTTYPGAGSNLEVTLGGISNYTSGTNATPGLHLIANLSVNDLVTAYGSSWNTRSDLTWGIAGVIGSSNKTLWLTYAEGTPGTQFDASGVNVFNSGARNTTGGAISPLAANLNGLASMSSSYASLVSTSQVYSWSTTGAFDGGTAFQFDNSTLFENTTSITGGSYAVSDLYQIGKSTPTYGGSTVTYIGSFGLSSTGALYFSTSAADFATPVPEPSTYAAIAGVLVLGVAAWRRQQKKAAAAAV